MSIGTVKWFNYTKGFGFIGLDEGGSDVFIHISALELSGIKHLTEGQRISYELINNRGKAAAGNLKILS